MEVPDTARPAPRLGGLDECPSDALPVTGAADAHHVELDRRRCVLLEAEEAEIGLHDESRERRHILDVPAGGLLDPEPVRQVGEHDLRDARPLGRVRDLDDSIHGRPVMRTPACPL